MNKLVIETIALLLMFAAFPLISLGTSQGAASLLIVGISCGACGGLLPIITRYLDHSNDKIRDAGIEFDDRAS